MVMCSCFITASKYSGWEHDRFRVFAFVNRNSSRISNHSASPKIAISQNGHLKRHCVTPWGCLLNASLNAFPLLDKIKTEREQDASHHKESLLPHRALFPALCKKTTFVHNSCIAHNIHDFFHTVVCPHTSRHRRAIFNSVICPLPSSRKYEKSLLSLCVQFSDLGRRLDEGQTEFEFEIYVEG